MELTIAKRFCGPPASGNGGYSCGRLAALVGNPAEITLRAPPPLETKLRVERADGVARLLHGEQLVAEGRPATLELEIPPPPSLDEARAAGRRFSGLEHHPYDTCFVCGPRRAVRDGLRLFCGPWKHGRVAGTWTPDDTLDDGKGFVAPEFLSRVATRASCSTVSRPRSLTIEGGTSLRATRRRSIGSCARQTSENAPEPTRASSTYLPNRAPRRASMGG
jgi:hypothetical protein